MVLIPRHNIHLGPQKMTFGLALHYGVSAQVEYVRKNYWFIKMVVLNERCCMSSVDLWDRFYCMSLVYAHEILGQNLTYIFKWKPFFCFHIFISPVYVWLIIDISNFTKIFQISQRYTLALGLSTQKGTRSLWTVFSNLSTFFNLSYVELHESYLSKLRMNRRIMLHWYNGISTLTFICQNATNEPRSMRTYVYPLHKRRGNVFVMYVFLGVSVSLG